MLSGVLSLKFATPESTTLSCPPTIERGSADPSATARKVVPGPSEASARSNHPEWTDVDAAWERAVEAGAEVIYPLEDQFYGERGGRLRDPFGQQWMMSQHIEDVPAGEMARRAQALFLAGSPRDRDLLKLGQGAPQ